MAAYAPELNAIVFDHESGALEVADRFLALAAAQASRSSAQVPSGLVDELFDTGVKVVRAHPAMAILFNVVNRLFSVIEAGEDAADEVGTLRLEILSAIKDRRARLASDATATAGAAADRIQNGDVVVTHSRSSTVLAALAAARQAGKNFDVVVTESRPLMEGRTLARQLAELQVPVRLVLDAAAPDAVQEADRVLVGADSVTRTGVLNKIGTRMLAQAASQAGVPMEVAAASVKAWRRGDAALVGVRTRTMRDPAQVWKKPPAGVDVVNPTFDLTPADKVTTVIHEHAAEGFDDFWKRVSAEPFARRVAQVFSNELA